MNVPHKPVEDIDVTMHTNVDVLQVFTVSKILIEILHVRNQYVSVTLKVLVPFLALITHVDYNLIVWVSIPWI